jgi:hypothetical protein
MSASRQNILVSKLSITHTSTGAALQIRLPPGAVPLFLHVVATAAMTGGSSPTITTTDGTNALTAAITGTNIDAVGKAVLLPAVRTYPNGATITFAYTGSPTAAAHDVSIAYVVNGRTTEQYLA